MDLEAHRVLNATRAIQSQGFDGVGPYLIALLSLKDKRVQQIAKSLVDKWSTPIISHILDRSKWGSGRRRTAKNTKLLSDGLGKQLINIILPILSTEFGVVIAMPFMRISPIAVCIS